jgi:hypothetical protein
LFWGKWPLKVLTWTLTVLGAFTTATPRIFPPLPATVEGLQISVQAAPIVVGVGAFAVVLGAVFKEIDGHIAKKRSLSALQSAARIIAGLHRSLPRMVGSEYSIDRRDAVVIAAQQCAMDLLRESGATGKLSVTFYQLEYEESEQPEGSTPGQRQNAEAVLVRVGDTNGRGVELARRDFKYDARGKDTIDNILAKKPHVCDDAVKQAKRNKWPEPSYGSYLSVPVLVEGEVEGMLSCDSTEKRDLRGSMKQMMSIPASFAGAELRASASATTPTKPPVTS